jgi:hypothetical protein
LADYTIIYVLAGLSVVQVWLTLTSAYFAYQITKVVGVFWAWALIVAAFSVNAIQNIISVVTIAFYPPDQLAALFAQFSAVQIWSGQLISLLTASLLMTGMYGLRKIFLRPKAARPAPQGE